MGRLLGCWFLLRLRLVKFHQLSVHFDALFNMYATFPFKKSIEKQLLVRLGCDSNKSFVGNHRFSCSLTAK